MSALLDQLLTPEQRKEVAAADAFDALNTAKAAWATNRTTACDTKSAYFVFENPHTMRDQIEQAREALAKAEAALDDGHNEGNKLAARSLMNEARDFLAID